MKWLRAIVIFVIALAVRLPGIADRPMHADEAVQAARLDGHTYDPNEYHGPVLTLLTRAAGVHSFSTATETRLRLVPAAAGSFLAVAMSFFNLPAGLFTALSPALTYYSKDYIPEILLVLCTVLMLQSAWRFVKAPHWAWAAATGALAGLAYATKETAVIAIAVSLCVALWGRKPSLQRVSMPSIVIACVAFVLTAATILEPIGFVRSLRSLPATWLPRAVMPHVHEHGPIFYLDLLLRTEWPVLLFAVLGSFRNVKVAAWTGLMLLIYSAIPYKTPWCALTPLIGLILLAGHGAGMLIEQHRWTGRTAVLAACVILLARAPEPVLSYAETTPDVFRLRASLERFDPATPVQVIVTGNPWPLPWYLRRFTTVRWWSGVPEDRPLAPIIIATPDMESELVRAMYEFPPPGKRTLYTRLNEDPVYLRNGVEIRTFVAANLP